MALAVAGDKEAGAGCCSSSRVGVGQGCEKEVPQPEQDGGVSL